MRAYALIPLLLLAQPLLAQSGKPKPKPKPPTPSSQGGSIVLGTKQLPGEFGKFGQTYTIGKEAPLNFTLVSAEYRADRFLAEVTDGVVGWNPMKTEKLLILKYTVQNPNNKDTRLWYNSFNIQAITGDDRVFKLAHSPWVGDAKRYVDMQLKPGQKVSVTCCLRVPSDGETPKLMVQRTYDDSAAVVRYDLRGKVAKLADKWSEDGFTPRDSVNLNLGEAWPFPGYDVTLVSAEKSTTILTGSDNYLRPEKDQDQWVLKFRLKGVASNKSRCWYGCWGVQFKTEDDLIDVYTHSKLIRSSSEAYYDGEVPQGEEITVRLICNVPKGTNPSQIRITYKNWDEKYRTANYKIGG
ncbi:MAG: hypothetical protein JST35_10160 [Armatimonadetes bacterium]|nr:hypothetical protein [Armatimonadota bacterium]